MVWLVLVHLSSIMILLPFWLLHVHVCLVNIQNLLYLLYSCKWRDMHWWMGLLIIQFYLLVKEGLVVNFVCMTLNAHVQSITQIVHVLFKVYHSLFVDIHVRCTFNFIWAIPLWPLFWHTCTCSVSFFFHSLILFHCYFIVGLAPVIT